jgi:hypothetical protein
MSNVDESVDKNDILDENPLVSDEDEDQHDPFEFSNDDNLDDILFPRCDGLVGTTIQQW